ncbi:MAG: Calx-beta domain-containing protein, partial [Limisphaerales bacterium]
MNAVHFRAGSFSRGFCYLLLALLGGSTALAQGVIIFSNAPPLIAAGSVWKYWNDYSAPDPRWKTIEYPASDWPSGAAQLGYGDGDEVTVTRTEGIPHSVSAYFRKSFVLFSAVTNARVRFRMVRDDGAVVYINGAEVVRDGMPPGEITHETLATISAGENENAFREYTATVSHLRAGTNVVAVEVHQVNAASSDLSFDFELNLVSNFTLLPVVSLTTVVEETKEAPLNEEILPGRFRVSRTGGTQEDLTVYLKVEGTAMESHDYPFIGQLIRIPAGRSEADIVIRAIDDNHLEDTEFVNVRLMRGPEGTSTAYIIHGEKFQGRVQILDNDVNTAANLRITEPQEGEVFPRGKPILINAVAVDTNGYIDRVEFYAGTNRIGVSELVFAQAPGPGTPIQHSILWSNAPSGMHSLTAAAWDSGQRRVKSEPVVILVSGEEEIPRVGVVFAPSTTTEPWPNADYAPGSFEFYRSGRIHEPLQVFFERGGTAIAGTDYVNFHQQIVFAAGQSRTNLPVQAIDDLLVEGRETVVVGLKPAPLGIDSLYPTYYAIDRTNRAATVLILDNDTAYTRATISITNPDNGDVFAVGTAIPIDAVAVDQNSYIPRVEFYAGATRIGVSEVNFVVAPDPGTPIHHSIEWNNAPPGDHLIVARGIDSLGNPVQSHPVQISVAPRAEGVTLSVEVIDPVASEGSITAAIDTATFRIRRVSGPTDRTVVVWLTMGGTAINGTDYLSINTLVAMPTNQTFIDIVVNPI